MSQPWRRAVTDLRREALAAHLARYHRESRIVRTLHRAFPVCHAEQCCVAVQPLVQQLVLLSDLDLFAGARLAQLAVGVGRGLRRADIGSLCRPTVAHAGPRLGPGRV